MSVITVSKSVLLSVEMDFLIGLSVPFAEMHRSLEESTNYDHLDWYFTDRFNTNPSANNATG